MLNPNYFSGKIEDRVAAGAQLARLSVRPNLAIIGPFGRAIMYEAFGYKDAAPLSLRVGGSDKALPLRPINALECVGYARDDERGPHEVDFDFPFDFFDLGAERPTLWPGRLAILANRIHVHPEAIEPVKRGQAPNKVKTLKIGTHLLIERMVVANQPCTNEVMPGENLQIYQEQRDGLAEFAAFADSMRDSHPEEFNDPSKEVAFEQVMASLK